MRPLLFTNLSLILASGVLPAQGVVPPILRPAELATRASALPEGVSRGLRYLQGRRADLGAGGDFKVRASTMNTQGQVVVHAEQTYSGFRVWGASTIVRVNADGASETTASSLEKGFALAASPRLGEDQALRIAHADVAPRGAYAKAPRAERIVFPTRYTGSLQLITDPATGRTLYDRRNSVRAPRPSADHVWAYEVISVLHNREDGILEMHHIVDANTGAILRKWDGVQHLGAAVAPVQAPGAYAALQVGPVRVQPQRLAAAGEATLAQAAVGTGNSQFLGTVKLDTRRNDAGGYDLVDTTRGTAPNPTYLGFVNNATFWDDTMNWDAWVPYQGEFGDTDNVWGDGQNYTDPIQPGHATDANGQTAAVDAHFGMAATWDFYKNVLNRDGVDGKGSSIGCVVHKADVDDYGNVNRFDNAFWTPAYDMMFYGDGTRTSTHPDGFLSLTEIDITGHEVSHGVASYTAQFDRSGESYGLNEGNSDIFGTMVEAYASRAVGQDATVPDTGTDYEMGVKSGAGVALRSMKKPSKDGYSPDAWYWGAGLLDQHFSCGPLTRAFYFLSQGASSDSAAETYSPYLPGGMTGVGNDRATRIWYKALTEHLTHDSGYQDSLDAGGKVVALGARSAAMKAAEDLYGAGSVEATAVENAFAGVNVGSAHGQAPRTLVVPYLANASGPAADTNPYQGTGPYVQYAAAGETIALKAKVLNNADTALTWKLGGSPGTGSTYTGGVLEADGTWRVPHRSGPANIRAYSHADPLQWGEMQFFIANLDADDDVEVDAVDMGVLAINWGFESLLRPSASVWGSYHVNNLDIYMFGEAFKAAFGK